MKWHQPLVLAFSGDNHTKSVFRKLSPDHSDVETFGKFLLIIDYAVVATTGDSSFAGKTGVRVGGG